MDFLQNLPQVEETPTKSDLEIIKFLVDESQKLKSHINIKQVFVATCIFVILVLPKTDSFIANKISDNTAIVIFIKVLIFVIVIVLIQVMFTK